MCCAGVDSRISPSRITRMPWRESRPTQRPPRASRSPPASCDRRSSSASGAPRITSWRATKPRCRTATGRLTDAGAWRGDARQPRALGARRMVPARHFHFGMESRRFRCRPQADLLYYDAEVHDARVFGAIHIEPIRDRLKLRAGRVDWGRAAFSPDATVDGLTARTVGLTGESPTRLRRSARAGRPIRHLRRQPRPRRRGAA